jgi:exodeoxyribonuclease-3
MRIATWNVNSIKQRMDHLTAWIAERSPDLVCLQETKCVDEAFPREPLEALGYNVAVHGQKAFNGVAVLSKLRFDEVTPKLPGEDAPDSDKYSYKIGWMERLARYTCERLRFEEPLVLAGDFNVIPAEADARNPARWVGDALFLPATRAKFRSLCNLGLTDAVRAASDGADLYTFWDYQAGAWQKNDGIRIDHLLLSPHAADRLQATGIDAQVRSWEKPSDHVPVWIDLALDGVTL